MHSLNSTSAIMLAVWPSISIMCLKALGRCLRNRILSKRRDRVYIDTDKSTTATINQPTKSNLSIESEEQLLSHQIGLIKIRGRTAAPFPSSVPQGGREVSSRFFYRLMAKRKCRDVMDPEQVSSFADVGGVLIYSKTFLRRVTPQRPAVPAVMLN